METSAKVRAEIWKYNLSVADEQSIRVPWDAKVLSVAEQHGGLVVYYWVLPANTDRQTRIIRIVGTGHSVDVNFDILNKFVGTVVTESGALVWHVFEGME